jgi:murein DD-endopeptidase MepM/ murein hydrolase activator NlpD
LRLPITPTLEPAPDIGGTSSSDSGGGSDDEGTLAAGIKASAVSTSGGGAWGAGRSYGGHAGVDISMPEGTKLLACCSGTVACVSKGWYGSTNGKGQGMISIKSDSKVGGFPAGTIFGYGHPDVIYLKKGDKVKAGDKLALSGSPGGGAHLHFFINTAGEACGNGNTNPTKFAKDALSRG